MRIFLLFISLIICHFSYAKTYYFSSGTGNDNRSNIQAQNPATPWKTLTKLNSFFNNLLAGDSILFKRGEIFYGTIIINKSGNPGTTIKLGAYGTGAKPIITGFKAITAWTNMSGNIWESTTAASTLSTCYTININGSMYAKGRMPKTGYWTIPLTNGSTTITDIDHLSTSVVSAGADVVVRELMYELNNHIISSVTGNTITFDAGSIPAGWGYFVQNDVKACTQQNDWCYNSSTKKISIYSTASPANVQVPTIEEAIYLNNNDYISFDNLDIQGYNRTGINTTSHTGINIQNCNFSFIGMNAVFAYPNSNSLIVTGSMFTDCGSRAICGGSSAGSIMNNNTLLRIGHFAGMGSNGDDSYIGIISNGDNSQVKYNSITNVGYCGIRCDGDSTLIQGNYINTFCYNKDDGGGIYCFSVQFGNVPHTQITRTLRDNIVLNAIGAPAGSIHGNQAAGLFLDGQSPNINVFHNTVGNDSTVTTGRFGIFVNGGHDINCDSNLVYNFHYNYYLSWESGPMYNTTITNNIFVATNSNASIGCDYRKFAGEFLFNSSDIPANFVANNNCYANPFDQANGWIYGSFTAPSCYTLEQWQAVTGKESGSFKSPVIITNVNDLRFEYNATSSDRIISLGSTTYIDMKGIPYSGSISLAPYSSLALIKATSLLNLKLYLQGYYDAGSGFMQPVLLNQGVGSSITETDTITVELHNPGSPYAIVSSAKAVLRTDGTVSLNFTPVSGSYYIVVKHRNVMQTWSANPVSVDPSFESFYDFTTAVNKAYANNQVEVNPGIWAFYTGDINQDEFIDSNDFPEYDIDGFNGISREYKSTDMNGDGFVDGNDFPVYDYNAFLGISSMHP